MPKCLLIDSFVSGNHNESLVMNKRLFWNYGWTEKKKRNKSSVSIIDFGMIFIDNYFYWIG